MIYSIILIPVLLLAPVSQAQTDTPTFSERNFGWLINLFTDTALPEDHKTSTTTQSTTNENLICGDNGISTCIEHSGGGNGWGGLATVLSNNSFEVVIHSNSPSTPQIEYPRRTRDLTNGRIAVFNWDNSIRFKFYTYDTETSTASSSTYSASSLCGSSTATCSASIRGGDIIWSYTNTAFNFDNIIAISVPQSLKSASIIGGSDNANISTGRITFSDNKKDTTLDIKGGNTENPSTRTAKFGSSGVYLETIRTGISNLNRSRNLIVFNSTVRTYRQLNDTIETGTFEIDGDTGLEKVKGEVATLRSSYLNIFSEDLLVSTDTDGDIDGVLFACRETLDGDLFVYNIDSDGNFVSDEITNILDKVFVYAVYVKCSTLEDIQESINTFRNRLPFAWLFTPFSSTIEGYLDNNNQTPDLEQTSICLSTLLGEYSVDYGDNDLCVSGLGILNTGIEGFNDIMEENEEIRKNFERILTLIVMFFVFAIAYSVYLGRKKK